MKPNTDTLLYFIGDWFDNRKYHSITIYRDTKADHVKLVLYNKWNKIIKQKTFRLFGTPEPQSIMWSTYSSPFGFDEAEATLGQVAAYFRRRKRGRKGSRRRTRFQNQYPQSHNAKKGKFYLDQLFGKD
jgi:hypothetical protein